MVKLIYLLVNLARFILFVFVFLSCSKTVPPISHELKDIDIDLLRFEKKFYGELKIPLDSIIKDFPYFFPNETPYHIWLNKRKDSTQQLLYNETSKISNHELETRTKKVFKYFNYYFPEISLPRRIISVQSDVDFLNRIIDSDTIMIISIDTFLGNKNAIYEGLPQYIRNELDFKFFESELINTLSYKVLPKTNSRLFLNKMINDGKRILLKDYLHENHSKNLNFNYSKSELQWAFENEKNVWDYFISNEILFSTENSLDYRFLNDSPYSKFYSNLDNGSPPRIGAFIGYRILESFIKRTNYSIQEILKISPQEILKKSNYNPT